MRLCTKCHIEKPESEFYFRKDRITCWCKTCQKEAIDQWKNDNPEKTAATRKRSRLQKKWAKECWKIIINKGYLNVANILAAPPAKKITRECIKCRVEKPESAFRKGKIPFLWCKDCTNLFSEEYKQYCHQRNLESNRRYILSCEEVNPQSTRECIKCHVTKPLSAFRKGERPFLWCKTCTRLYNEEYKQYRLQKLSEDNKCRKLTREKEWWNQYHRQWYKKNKDKITEKARQKYEANPEKARKKSREANKRWRETSPQKYKESRKRSKNTPKGKAAKKRHDVRRRSAFAAIVCDLTANEWQAILVEHNYLCHYQKTQICKDYGGQLIEMLGMTVEQVDALGLPARKATQDHVHPVSKGGNHTADNIVPSCISCNSSKFNKILTEPK